MSTLSPSLRGWGQNLKGDIFGGITSAVVALPLALAFGVLSGAGASAGLYSAIFTGIIAAIFGGSPAQITGPTGGMTVVLVAVFKELGLPGLFMAMFMAGLIQIALSFVKVGRYIHYIPHPVIAGFTNGIAVLIFSQQLATLRTADGALNMAAIAMALSVVVTMFAWPHITKVIPGSLVGPVATTIVASLLARPDLALIGEIPAGIPRPHFSFLLTEWPHIAQLLRPAIMLALLGAMESLLAAVVVDELAGTRHNSDRELFGQGLGNAVATLFGGIAGTGAIVRSAVNVRAGGRTPLSGVLHGVLILLVTVALGRYAALIPLATLAGILMVTAIGMVDWESIRDLRKAPVSDSVVMLITAGLTVFTDLVTAVSVGVVLSMAAFTGKMSQAPVSSRLMGGALVISLNGPFFFGLARRFLDEVEGATSGLTMIWDLSAVTSVDATGAVVIRKGLRIARDRSSPILWVGLHPAVRQVLGRLEVLEESEPHHFMATVPEALAMAASLGRASEQA